MEPVRRNARIIDCAGELLRNGEEGDAREELSRVRGEELTYDSRIIANGRFRAAAGPDAGPNKIWGVLPCG